VNFFTAFHVWVQTQLTTYIADRTASMAMALEPFVALCAVIYVLFWGWLQLTGRIEQPVVEGAKRILVLATVIGLSVDLWAYNALFVDTFMTSPQRIAVLIANAPSAPTITTADTVLTEGVSVAENLFRQGGVLDGNMGFYLIGLLVYLLVGLTAGYAAFLDALAQVALSVILAIGPLFIVGLLFDATRRFFEAWISQLCNYGLITVLTGAVTGLLMQIVQTEATQLAADGTGVQIAEVVPLMAACLIVLLVMRQIMPMASGLASGVALASMGVVSHAMSWGLGRTSRMAGALTQPSARTAPHLDPATRLPALPTAAGATLAPRHSLRR
jgi:type IV secretion system protein VirB6